MNRVNVLLSMCFCQCGSCGHGLQSSGSLHHGVIYPPGGDGEHHRGAAARHVGRSESRASSGERRQPGATVQANSSKR